jgi:aryl-alcohol dehydrogenase-like predicted oxidoreductase
LLADGYLNSLKSRGIEIHVRSVFLQGVILMSENELPTNLSGLIPYLQRYRQENQKLGVLRLQAAIGFVDQLPEVDTILVGVNNLQQLTEIFTAAECKFDTDYLKAFAVEDEALINPALWRR